MIFDEKAIIGRIRQLREQHAGKRGKALFAKELGISASTYNYYEQDRLAPVEVLWTICQKTGTELEWLLTGQISGGQKEGYVGVQGGVLGRVGELLGRDPGAGAVIGAFVDLLEQKAGKEAGEGKKESRQGSWVPILGRTAAGVARFWGEAGGMLPGLTELSDLIARQGGGQYREQPVRDIIGDTREGEGEAGPVSLVQLAEAGPEGVCEFVESAAIRKAYPDAFALRVDGESMAPQIGDGDIVVLSPARPARDGAAAVVQLKEQIGVTCKIIRRDKGKVHLIPVNEKFDTRIYEESQLAWALAVLWRIRFK